MSRLRRLAAAFSMAPLCAVALHCGRQTGETSPGGVPEDIARSNAVAAALLSQQRPAEAEAELRRALARRPRDPVLLVNTAIALLELGKGADARSLLDEAVGADPASPHAHYVLGLLEKEAGNFERAAERFRAVAELDPDDVTTRYQLGASLARLGRHPEAEAAYRRALELDPTHVASLYGLGRLLLEGGNEREGRELIEESQRVRARAGEAGRAAETLGAAYGEKGPYAMAVDYPGGGLLPPPAPASLEFVEATATSALPSSQTAPSPANLWTIGPFGEGEAPSLVFLDRDGVHALGSAGARKLGPAPPEGVRGLALAAGDVDGDGRTEIVVLADRPARGGRTLETRLLSPRGDGFAWDVPPAGRPTHGLPLESDPGEAALVLVDVDHDGDLDLFAAWSGGPGAALGTNDGSGRFALARQGAPGGIFPSSPPWSPDAVTFSDLDNDRDVDLVAGEGDRITIWSNRRDGSFAARSAAAPPGAAAAGSALLVADLDKDGFLDVLASDGRAPLVCPNRRGRLDPCRPLSDRTAAAQPPGAPRGALAVLDADNDGFLDVAASEGGRLVVYRNEGRGRFARHEAGPEAGEPLAAVDADGDGRMDLAVRKGASGFALLRNETRAGHGHVSLRLRGARDNRNGIGAKVEILAGALRQKLEVTRPVPVHFGLGPRASADAVRILWPSGVLQDEIGVGAGRTETVAQLDRKGTSCPLLYAWRGGAWRFVTDFLGGSAIGYRHGSGELSVPDTDEYVLIEDGLEPEGGRLRVRFNNQLEEVLFFDRVELVAVDHPAGTLLFPDERLMPGPPWPPFRLFASRDVRPLRAAREIETGRDVTQRLLERDRQYADGFPLLPFKGYAEPHTLEMAFGPLPEGRRLVLLLDGWIDYADSSSNLAASQAGVALDPPRLFVGDRSGGWREATGRMGFPAGLPKTMTVDLTGWLDPREPRLRIRTNMRIYWDRARIMVGGEDTPLRVRRLAPARAELRFGGFPKETSPDGRPPFSYDPARVDASGGWKAHAGLYTAFGDVTDLLLAADDRFVVTRNGDEVEAAFEAPPPPAPGSERSYLFFAEGFGKDMDPNSAAADTVGPIPFHGMPRYPYGPEVVPPPRSLESVRGGRRVLDSEGGLPGARPLALLRKP